MDDLSAQVSNKQYSIQIYRCFLITRLLLIINRGKKTSHVFDFIGYKIHNCLDIG